MNEKLQKAFSQVRSEADLKEHTRIYLAQQTKGWTKQKATMPYVKYALIGAVVILMMLTGHTVYYTATAKISIDINPSIELSVNRFNQVIAVNGYNKDGEALASTLSLRYQNYDEALDKIVKSDTISAMLNENEVMTITVTGRDKAQSRKILAQIESHTADQVNTYCYHASDKDVVEAHEAGLSFGKYRAFLELKNLVPDMESEDVQDMTMREIHDLIHEHSNTGNEETAHGHHGHGKGQGQRNGRHQRNNNND